MAELDFERLLVYRMRPRFGVRVSFSLWLTTAGVARVVVCQIGDTGGIRTQWEGSATELIEHCSRILLGMAEVGAGPRRYRIHLPRSVELSFLNDADYHESDLPTRFVDADFLLPGDKIRDVIATIQSSLS